MVHEDDRFVHESDILAIARWNPSAVVATGRECTFSRKSVLHDFTGVPLLVELLAMREAVQRLGGDSQKVTPLLRADLVIDHSSQVDKAGSPLAFASNAALEMAQNSERYALLRWGQKHLRNLNVVPPNTGICHQVNLEYLSKVIVNEDNGDSQLAYPDTLVGMDSHTPMANALGIVGWGVGGIEAEAAMLGQPISMQIPPVTGVKLRGALQEGTTATDLVLALTRLLRSMELLGISLNSTARVSQN